MNKPDDKQFLIVEDDAILGPLIKSKLQARGYNVVYCGSIDEAKKAIAQNEFSWALLDLVLHDENSLPLIPLLRQANADIKILMLTGFASIATAVEAVKLGADNYLPKPATIQEILHALEQTSSDANSTVEPAVEATPLSTRRLEWEHIQRVLHKNDGNISATARELNMHRRTLQRKLQKSPVKK